MLVDLIAKVNGSGRDELSWHVALTSVQKGKAINRERNDTDDIMYLFLIL